MKKLPVYVTIVVSSLAAFAATGCKPAAKGNNANQSDPNQNVAIVPVGVTGSEIQVAGASFPARIQFQISGVTDPSKISLALVERPANTSIESRATLQPVLLWTPSTSQPQAYVQFVIRDMTRCQAATGNSVTCALADGQISPGSPAQPYDKLSTRFLLRFTGDSRVLQANNSAVVPGTQVIPGSTNGGSTIGGTILSTVENQVMSGAGRIATTFIGNGFSTTGMTWQQILQNGFGIPTTTTTTSVPSVTTAGNGIR